MAIVSDDTTADASIVVLMEDAPASAREVEIVNEQALIVLIRQCSHRRRACRTALAGP
jgi:hypothetical protein